MLALVEQSESELARVSAPFLVCLHLVKTNSHDGVHREEDGLQFSQRAKQEMPSQKGKPCDFQTV